MLGRESSIGSLAPGKKADLVVINATDLNLWPVHDPVSTVLMQSSIANIEAVMIDGVWRKRDGHLLADNLDHNKNELERSGLRIVSEIERQEKAA
jgi:5-methylthioadenosine/S-adenosylhomocysteine deaminase